MSSQNKRSGGKFGGKHSSFIDDAIILVDEASHYPEVTTISAGIIISSGRATTQIRRIKFTIEGSVLFLKIRQKISVQEVRIYSSNLDLTIKKLSRFARSEGIVTAYGESK